MKLLLAGCLCILTPLAFAQDEADFKTWMKTTAATMGSLRKNLEAKQAADVANDAQKVADIYKQVGAFFAKAHADDAVAIAKNGETAANDLVTAANAGNLEQAAAGAKTLGGTCGPCHMAHREKLEAGGYKIK